MEKVSGLKNRKKGEGFGVATTEYFAIPGSQFGLSASDGRQIGGAVITFAFGIMGLMINGLLPISLIPSIAHDFKVSEALAGQSITLTAAGAFAASLFIVYLSKQIERQRFLLILSILLIGSSLLIFFADNFTAFLIVRSLLGITAGSFHVWIVLTMRSRISETQISQAFAILFGAVLLAVGCTVPIGIVLEGILGWRGALLSTAVLGWLPCVFRSSTPAAAKSNELTYPPTFLNFCKRPEMLKTTVMMVLMFGGNFIFLVYFGLFFKTIPSISIQSLSVLLLVFLIASLLGILGSESMLRRQRYITLIVLPFCLGFLALVLVLLDHLPWVVYCVAVLWGFCQGPFLVGWTRWFSQNLSANSALVLISVIQLSIVFGAIVGGIGLAISDTMEPLVVSGGVLVLVPVFMVIFLSPKQ